MTRDYDLLPLPFRVGPNMIPQGGYSWNTFTATVTSDDSRRIYGGGGVDVGGYYGGDKRTYRANVNFLPRETLLVENQLHAQRDHAAGRADLRDQHAEHPGQLLAVADTLREGVRAVQRRAPARHAQPVALVDLPARQRFLRRVQPGVGHRRAGAATRCASRNRVLAVKLTYWLSR